MQIRFSTCFPALLLLWSTCCLADDAETAKIQPGETVTVTAETVEFGVLEKVAAVLESGHRIRVTEVRGDWIGGYTIVASDRKTGWVHRDKVKLQISASASEPILALDLPDDQAAVEVLKALGVELELDGEGRVQVANASDSKVTDADMVHFSKLYHLATLELSGRPISDEGLKPLAKNVALQQLFLDATKIGDRGLQHLRPLGNIEFLVLKETAITDAGLANLRPLQHLRSLNLSNCGITDKGLPHLAAITSLEVLAMPDTKVTGKGLIHIPWLAKLRVLNVNGNDVDDDGIAQLRNMEELRMLYVRETIVTDEGAEKLGEDMPSLAIYQ